MDRVEPAACCWPSASRRESCSRPSWSRIPTTPGPARCGRRSPIPTTNRGRTSITFAITPTAASYTINLQTALPAITVPVLIDGTSSQSLRDPVCRDPNHRDQRERLSGQDALLLAPGSDGSTIQGLDIADFQDPTSTTGAGIHIESNGNLVQEDYLGTDLTGKSAGPGNLYGIFIDGGSRNTIGGAGSLGNLISGNTGAGVQIQDDVQLAQNNLVIGNKIGTDVTGTAALPNQGDGEIRPTIFDSQQHDRRHDHGVLAI